MDYFLGIQLHATDTGLEIVEPLAYPFKGMCTHIRRHTHTSSSDAHTSKAFDVHTSNLTTGVVLMEGRRNDYLVKSRNSGICDVLLRIILMCV